MDEQILNVGLDLALEWGMNWLQPIQERLAARFPPLTPAQLDSYDQLCREVMNWGFQQAPLRWHEAGGSEAEAYRLFKDAILGFPSPTSAISFPRVAITR